MPLAIEDPLQDYRETAEGLRVVQRKRMQESLERTNELLRYNRELRLSRQDPDKNPVHVTTPEQYESLPPNTSYTDERTFQISPAHEPIRNKFYKRSKDSTTEDDPSEYGASGATDFVKQLKENRQQYHEQRSFFRSKAPQDHRVQDLEKAAYSSDPDMSTTERLGAAIAMEMKDLETAGQDSALYTLRRVPFSTSTLVEKGFYNAALERIHEAGQNGERADTTDILAVARAEALLAHEMGYGFWKGAGDMGSYLPGMAVEWATTGPIYSGAKKWAAKKSVGPLARLLGKTGLTLAQRRAIIGPAVGIISRGVGVSAQFQAMPNRLLNRAATLKTPKFDAADGEIVIDPESRMGTGEAIFKSQIAGISELAWERAGGRMLRPFTNRWVGKAAQKSYMNQHKISKVALDKLLKKPGFKRRMMSQYRASKMATGQAALAKLTGFGSMPGELAEEAGTELTQGVLGSIEKATGLKISTGEGYGAIGLIPGEMVALATGDTEQFNDEIPPGIKTYLQMGIAFGGMQGGQRLLSIGINRLEQSQRLSTINKILKGVGERTLSKEDFGPQDDGYYNAIVASLAYEPFTPAFDPEGKPTGETINIAEELASGRPTAKLFESLGITVGEGEGSRQVRLRLIMKMREYLAASPEYRVAFKDDKGYRLLKEGEQPPEGAEVIEGPLGTLVEITQEAEEEDIYPPEAPEAQEQQADPDMQPPGMELGQVQQPQAEAVQKVAPGGKPAKNAVLEAMLQKSKLEDQGQEMSDAMDELDEQGITPQQVIQRFFDDVYPNLNDAQRKNIERHITSVLPDKIGDIKYVDTKLPKDHPGRDVKYKDFRDLVESNFEGYQDFTEIGLDGWDKPLKMLIGRLGYLNSQSGNLPQKGALEGDQPKIEGPVSDVITVKPLPKKGTVARRKLDRERKAAEEAQKAADEAAAKAEIEGDGTLGAVIGPLTPGQRRRADVVPDSVKAPRGDVERQLAESHGVPQESTFQRWLKGIKSVTHVATRSQRFLPNTKRWGYANEWFRLLKNIPNNTSDEANRNIAAVVDPLGKQQLQLFSRKVVIDNLASAVERGEPLRFGFENMAEIEQYQKQLDQLVENTPEVKQAVETRRAIVREIVERAVELNILDADALENSDTYYHQQVLDYVDASRGAGKVGPQIKKKGFQRRRVKDVLSFDENLNYNTSYIEAEHAWMRDALGQIALQESLATLNEKEGILDEVEADAKKRDVPVNVVLREKKGYRAWQPDPGNVFHLQFGVSDAIASAVFQGMGEEINLTAEDLQRLLSLDGKKPSYVLPEQIVDQLESMTRPRPDGPAGAIAKELMKMWKVWTLLNPKRAIGYNLRNLTGDIDPVLGGAPGVLKFTGRATKELFNYHVRKRLSLSPQLRTARDLGVIGSSLTAQEIPSLKELAVFNRFYSSKLSASKMLGRYFDTVKKYTVWREDTLRYASFLYYRKKLRDGTLRNYGGAKKAVVDAIHKEMGVEEAAAHLARNLLGDYGNMTVMGEWLRTNAMPFYSWLEVNAKRWPKMFSNAVKSGLAKGSTVFDKSLFSSLAVMQLGMLTFLMHLWNRLRFPDDEDDLSNYDRANPHIILGHNVDGTAVILRNTGALGDFLEWFGVNTLLSRWEQLQEGQISPGEVAKEMAKDPINKLYQGIRPDAKAAIEIPAGTSGFPDTFNPRSVDRDELAAGVLGLQDEWKWLKGKIFKDGSRARPHYFARLFGISDPRRNALYEIYDLRERFLKKQNQDRLPRGDQIFKKMREAAIAEDYEAFKEAREKYVAKKGFGNFKASLENLDPIARRLKDEDEERFANEYLTTPQREKLRLSRNYAGELRVRLYRWWLQASKEQDTPKQQSELSDQVRRDIVTKVNTLSNAKPEIKKHEKNDAYQERLKRWQRSQKKSRAWLEEKGISRERAEQLYEDALWNPDSKMFRSTSDGRTNRLKAFDKHWPKGK